MLVFGVATWQRVRVLHPPLPDGRSAIIVNANAHHTMWPTYQFQQDIRGETALGALLSGNTLAQEPSVTYGFEPLSQRTLFFRVGTAYAELLAVLQSDLRPQAMHRAQLLVRALDRAKAPAVLTAHLRGIHALLEDPQYTGQTVAQVLATFEPLYESVYSKATNDEEELSFFRLGAWLVNLSLAASASDHKALRQGNVVQALQRDLTPNDLSADALAKLTQLHDLMIQPVLNDQEIHEVYRLVQNLQRRLRD
jgi:hypothetical protein